MLGCPIINSPLLGFPHGSAVWGSGVVAAVTLVMAMAQVCSLPRELLRALGPAQINTYVKIVSFPSHGAPAFHLDILAFVSASCLCQLSQHQQTLKEAT